MSDTEKTENQKEAEEALRSRLEAFRAYLAYSEDGGDVDDDGPNEELGSLSEYGLEWTKTITDHRRETVTYVHVLSTGGPGDEFQVTFDPKSGKVESVTFVFWPWSDRVEIDSRDFPELPFGGEDDDDDDGEEIAKDFYASFFGDLVQADHEQ